MMMKLSVSALLLICAAYCSAIEENDTQQQQQQLLRNSQQQHHQDSGRSLGGGPEHPCTAIVIELLHEDGGGIKQLICEDEDSGMIHAIPSAEPEWIEEQVTSGALLSGESQMELPNGNLNPTDSLPVFFTSSSSSGSSGKAPSTRRRMTSTEGTRDVLLVRVMADNVQYDYTEDDTADKWFGTFGDPVTMSSQYAECSHDKLHFVPTTNLPAATATATNGVMTVHVPGDLLVATTPWEMYDNHNKVTSVLFELFDGDHPFSHVDHVVYLMPSVLYSTTLAYAGFNSWFSAFSNGYANNVGVQMHELGHNLGLHHSGEGGRQYGDTSGVMGAYFGGDQQVCFNGAKFWQLGWFNDQSLTLDPVTQGSQSFHLLSFTEYDPTASANPNPVLVKIIKDPGSDTGTDYFMVFNRKIGRNSGTRGGADQVTIVQQAPGVAISSVLTRLGEHQHYTIHDFGGVVGHGVKISVHQIDLSNNVATVDVDYLDAANWAGACVGTGACGAASTFSGIGANSCTGTNACALLGADAMIGAVSCTGEDACHAASAAVGAGSCDGIGACYAAGGFVGTASCIGDLNACYFLGSEAKIGAGSCMGSFSCFAASGTVGASSCIADWQACESLGREAKIGARSCVGEVACRAAEGTVGADSCLGDNTCNNLAPEVLIGAGSCIGASACTTTQDPVVGDQYPVVGDHPAFNYAVGANSCQGVKACEDAVHSGEGIIGAGSCIGENACQETAVTLIGAGSCTAADSCKQGTSGGKIGAGSCTGVGSCVDTADDFEAGAGACTGVGSCLRAKGPKSAGACTTTDACSEPEPGA